MIGVGVAATAHATFWAAIGRAPVTSVPESPTPSSRARAPYVVTSPYGSACNARHTRRRNAVPQRSSSIAKAAGEVLLQLLANVAQRIRVMVCRVHGRRPFREVHRAQPGLACHQRQ